MHKYFKKLIKMFKLIKISLNKINLKYKKKMIVLLDKKLN